jgi:hypothetical protein
MMWMQLWMDRVCSYGKSLEERHQEHIHALHRATCRRHKFLTCSVSTPASTIVINLKMELGSWVESFVNEKKHPFCTAFDRARS